MSKIYLVTGANSGLGLDCSRQLALLADTKLVYLGCRSEEKANAAMDKLTGCSSDRTKFKYYHFDASATKAEIEKDVQHVEEDFLDGFVMNAGGFGPANDPAVSENGVTTIAQINLIAHFQLLDSLVEFNKIGKGTRVIYSGSEGARGIPAIGFKGPDLETICFEDKLSGKAYAEIFDLDTAYADTKGMAALYLSRWARDHATDGLYVLTVSPGGTRGTAVADQGSIPLVKRVIFRVMQNVLGLFGTFHALEIGAKRYVDAVTGELDSDYPTGTFVASQSGMTGQMCDQTKVPNGEVFGKTKKQDAAYEALRAVM